ncbi:hypothetical protein [Serratia marcescens]|uniref:hypothetical protein n=1 Tax=Serratia marcescens TaxID=615 RepID=UPI003FA723EC
MYIRYPLIISLLFFAKTAMAFQECASLIMDIDKRSMMNYKSLVQKTLSQKVSLNDIVISQVLTERKWHALTVSTKIAEPGVFFFKNKKFIDVWGGDVYPQDKSNVLAWAKKNHIPDQLANCFYESIVIR